MEKSSLILIAALVVAAIFVCTQARAQEFSAPIPVGSTQSQVGAGAPATKTNATSIEFSTLPDASGLAGAQNFKTNSVEFSDGTTAGVQDIIATPGLLKDPPTPLPPPATTGGMLDDMQPEEALGDVMISPTHGFCPEQWDWTKSPTIKISVNFQCNVQTEVPYPVLGGVSGGVEYKKNRFDHQYEVADIRNALEETEFGRVFGGMDPLVAGLLGDAEEGLVPYQPVELYPATVINENTDKTFTWKWISSGGELTNLDTGYDRVYANSITEIEEEEGKGGFVSAAYDPLNLEKQLKASWIVDVASTWHLVGGTELNGNKFVYKLLHSYFSPLVFFRKDTANDRLRLAGYSTWQLKSWGGPMWLADLQMFLKQILLSFNMGPISLQSFKDSVGDREYTRISVVNQGTLGSLEQLFRNKRGEPADINPATPGVETAAWRDLLLDDTGAAMPTSGASGSVFIPHQNVSYIVFNEKPYDKKWINDLSDKHSDNPNEFIDPTITRMEGGDLKTVPGFALVGPGMFDSAVITDTIGGIQKNSLIVPSGEKAMDDKYYIYKFTPNDAQKLYLANTSLLIGIAGEPYAVATPGDGWAPYGIVTGNINGGNCQAFALTFRGAQTLWDPTQDSDTSTSWFDNHNSPTADQVHFDNSNPELKQMFSECVDLHYGFEDGGKCKYKEEPDQRICMKKTDTDPGDPAWQIAKGIAIHDMNEDGRNDLIIGNLNPMLMAGTDPKTYTAYVAIFENTESWPSGQLFTETPNKTVRVGYAKTEVGPLPDDNGKYLVDVWSGRNGITGVSELKVGANGEIGSTIGFPLMYAPYGCPKFSADPADTAIESPLEALWALIYNWRNPGISTGPGENVMPMRCLPSMGTPPTTPTSTFEAYRPRPMGTIITPSERVCAVPSGITPKCCVDTCGTLPGSIMSECCGACAALADPFAPPYDILCNMLRPCCSDALWPSSALSTPKEKIFADSRGGDGGSGNDGGGTDFAKCDKVYDSKAPFIASMEDLKPAQAETNLSSANVPAANINTNDTQLKQLMDQIRTFLIEDAKLTEAQADEAINQIKQAASAPGTKMLFNELIRPFIEVVIDQYNASENQNVAPKNTTNDKSSNNWLGLISEANANPLGGEGILLFTDPGKTTTFRSNFRFPRGHDPAQAAKREITVVLKKTPPPPTTTTTTIPEEAVPGTVEEGAPVIETKCSTFSSPAIESYFNDLNEKARKLLPGLKTSDLFCEAEGMMEASIFIPGADKGVGAIIQRNGSLPEDFTGWTELKGKANIAATPTKLLPVESAKGMKVVTPDLSQAITGLSEAIVPLASDIVTSVGGNENTFMLNNVLSWEMSTDTTKQVGVETVVNKVYNRVQPLMKSWSASGESDAFLKENAFANYDMEQVLSQLAANASLCHDGFCELKAVKGLWPDYQTYNLMLVQGMKSTRAGVALPPVKVEFAYLGTPSAKAMGGGPSCKCDMTAQTPDIASVIALLLVTLAVSGGFVVVRVFHSPSFVRRGKGR